MYSFGRDPWTCDPALAPLSTQLANLVAQCSESEHAPLGGLDIQIFSKGGFATIQLPLESRENASAPPPCFGEGTAMQLCVHASLPSAADLIPYANLALQGK